MMVDELRETEKCKFAVLHYDFIMNRKSGQRRPADSTLMAQSDSI
jgi:hypothetical protein